MFSAWYLHFTFLLIPLHFLLNVIHYTPSGLWFHFAFVYSSCQHSDKPEIEFDEGLTPHRVCLVGGVCPRLWSLAAQIVVAIATHRGNFTAYGKENRLFAFGNETNIASFLTYLSAGARLTASLGLTIRLIWRKPVEISPWIIQTKYLLDTLFRGFYLYFKFSTPWLIWLCTYVGTTL